MADEKAKVFKSRRLSNLQYRVGDKISPHHAETRDERRQRMLEEVDQLVDGKEQDIFGEDKDIRNFLR